MSWVSNVGGDSGKWLRQSARVSWCNTGAEDSHSSMSPIAEAKDSQYDEGCEAILWHLIEDVSHVGDSGQYGHCDIVISEFC